MSSVDSVIVKIEGDKQTTYPKNMTSSSTDNKKPSSIGFNFKHVRRVSFPRRLLTRSSTRSKLLELGELYPAQAIKDNDVPDPLLDDDVPDPLLDDDVPDPLLDDDIPEEFKKVKIDKWFVLEWVCLVSILAALVCSFTVPVLEKHTVRRMKLWKWEILVLVLICGRLVSGWIIRIIVFCIEKNFLLRKRVLYFVYGLKNAVQNCLWLALVLLPWHFLFDSKVENKALKYVTKILICLLVGTCIWLIKTLLIEVLASSFQVKTYFDRIQDSLFNQYVIETLSGHPLVEEEKSRRLIGSNNDEGVTIDHLHRLNTKNVSAWNMKKLMSLIRNASFYSSDEQLKDTSHEDETAKKIRSENEAKTAARKILLNVAKPGCRFIYMEDLLRFMQEDKALKTMNLFKNAYESNRISKSALKIWAVNAFSERRGLALTLNDTKTAVNKLHRIVNVLVAIIILVIWLLMLGIATSRFMLFLTSQLVVVAFIFGNTCKTVFECIIFLFVIHPFDVGDRCEIDEVQMTVEEMNILTTVFLRFDNQKIMYPNSVLLNKSIANYYRSPHMGDAVEFCVHIATPPKKIAMVKQRIASHIKNKKDHWYPTPLIIIKDLDELNRVRIEVRCTHKMSHQNMDERHSRRSMLIDKMIKIFREVDMQYRLYPIDGNVRTTPPRH